MINFYSQVPLVYPKVSRDFQYLSWLINIVLNSVKHNIDAMYDLPNTKVDIRLTELLALTLGFKVKRSYNQQQLIALVSIIPSLLKYKGTEKAITMAAEALIRASGSDGIFSYKELDGLIEVCLPEGLVDVTLFTDLLPYIMPAGMTCKIVRKTQKQSAVTTNFDYSELLVAKSYKDIDWNTSKDAKGTINENIGLSTLFSGTGTEWTGFSNYSYTDTGHELNRGLLDNAIIPNITNSFKPVNPFPSDDDTSENNTDNNQKDEEL